MSANSASTVFFCHLWDLGLNPTYTTIGKLPPVAQPIGPKWILKNVRERPPLSTKKKDKRVR